jgi:teichuronic acid biosynthesis glycosyltransferase TuaH
MSIERNDYDIIIFTLFRDDNAFSSVSLSFAREFAKNHRVFYINHPYSLLDYWRGRKDQKVRERATDMWLRSVRYEEREDLPNIVIVQPPLTLPINWLPDNGLYDWLYRQNNKSVARAMKETIEKYGIKNYLYYNCYDPFFMKAMPLSLPVQPIANIYHCIDELDFVPYSARHGKRLERETIENADIALTTASALRTKYLPIKPETLVVNNAVDISIFRKVLTEKFERPKEIAQVRGKIIGFTGNLDEVRINYPLFRRIAEQHRDKTLVIVGPVNSPEFYAQGLHKMQNVIFTGAKKITELPQYAQFFDVAIIPFLINEITHCIYPLKINEYLAAGLPVVATSFSDDIRSFSEVIYVANDENHFIRLIDTAIKENNTDRILQRAQVAQGNTWTDRVEQIWQIVENHVAKTGKVAPNGRISKFIEPAVIVPTIATTNGKVVHTLAQNNVNSPAPATKNGAAKTPTESAPATPEVASSGLKTFVKSSPTLRRLARWLMIPTNEYRPRWWVRAFWSRLKHRRGRGSIIKWRTRLDVFPYNKFDVGEKALIEDFATINNAVGDVVIGDRSLIGISSVVIGPVCIGSDVLLAQNVVLSGLNHVFEDIHTPIARQMHTTKAITIADGVWIGANAVVVAGTTVGKNSVVAGGSVVTKDVPPYCVVAGNPAKIVRQYNAETMIWERPSHDILQDIGKRFN